MKVAKAERCGLLCVQLHSVYSWGCAWGCVFFVQQPAHVVGIPAGMRSFPALKLPGSVLLVSCRPIAPAVIFCSVQCFWMASQQGFTSCPCVGMSQGGDAEVSYYCPPWELLRAVPPISGDNCCVSKHFLCPSKTLRLHPKIQNRGDWNSWKILLNLLDQYCCFYRWMYSCFYNFWSLYWFCQWPGCWSWLGSISLCWSS